MVRFPLMKKFHIVANASPFLPIPTYPSHDVIALDGAAETLKKFKIIPKIIIGDLDSISPKTLKFFAQQQVAIIKDSDQNSTDLDKGIRHALSLGAEEIIISNALGGRIDHTL